MFCPRSPEPAEITRLGTGAMRPRISGPICRLSPCGVMGFTGALAIGTGLPSGGDRRALTASAALSRSAIILWCGAKSVSGFPRGCSPNAPFARLEMLTAGRRMALGNLRTPKCSLHCSGALQRLEVDHRRI